MIEIINSTSSPGQSNIERNPSYASPICTSRKLRPISNSSTRKYQNIMNRSASKEKDEEDREIAFRNTKTSLLKGLEMNNLNFQPIVTQIQLNSVKSPLRPHSKPQIQISFKQKIEQQQETTDNKVPFNDDISPIMKKELSKIISDTTRTKNKLEFKNKTIVKNDKKTELKPVPIKLVKKDVKFLFNF